MATRNKKHIADFRRWIIERLKESQWVSYQDEDLEAESKRLGLRPELLREAQTSLAEDCRRQGRQPMRLGKQRMRAERGRARFEIVLPRVVHEDWRIYCESRELTSAVLLRSLIHGLLSRVEQPSWLGPYWHYRGQKQAICLERRGQRGKYLTVLCTDITRGASHALVRRANNSNVLPSALVRGAILDLLEGRTTELTILVLPGEMWDDADRYYTLDGGEDDGGEDDNDE